jgi:hypothetical protein
MGGSELARPGPARTHRPQPVTEENGSGSFGGPVWAWPLDLESLSAFVPPLEGAVGQSSLGVRRGTVGGSPWRRPLGQATGALPVHAARDRESRDERLNWAQVIGEGGDAPNDSGSVRVLSSKP